MVLGIVATCSSCGELCALGENFTHICQHGYTPTDLAYVTDMHHDLNLTGIDNVRKIEYTKKDSRKC
jgi:hypothetical protein